MRLVSAVLALEAEEGSEEAEDCSQQTFRFTEDAGSNE